MKLFFIGRYANVLNKSLFIAGLIVSASVVQMSAQTTVQLGTNGYSITTTDQVINPLNATAATAATASEPDLEKDVPVLLKGIWYNTNRYVIFDTGYDGEVKQSDGTYKKGQIPQVVLRSFYTWYDDRAAEAKAYTEKTGSKTVNVSGEDTSPVASTTSEYFSSTDTASSGSVRNLTYALRVNGPTETNASAEVKRESIPETARDRNNATGSSPAEELKIRFVPLMKELFPASYNISARQSDGSLITADTVPSGAWDLEITYPYDRTVYHVPVAVIGNNLYLHFTIKSIGQDSTSVTNGYSSMGADAAVASNPLTGFWQDCGNASGILISPPITSKELLSYYITDSACYHIRYWKTDMEYDPDAEAVFSDGGQSFTVKKHLLVGGLVYTCVTGRGTKIRNIEKSEKLPESFTLNSVLIQKRITQTDGTVATVTTKDATICALGEPYLTLTDGKQTIEQLVVSANNRRKPLPKPLFPPSTLDFHLEIINELRKYNSLFSSK